MLLAEPVESVTAGQPLPTIPDLMPGAGNGFLPLPTATDMTTSIPTAELEVDVESGQTIIVKTDPNKLIPDTPFYKKWWFWLAITIAAGGAIYVFTRKPKV